QAAPDNLRLDAFAVQQRTSTSELLRAVRDNPAALIADPKRDLRTFRVAAVSPLGTKRGTGRGGFIDSVLASVDGFYEVVIQQLRPWVARAPQLPGSGRTAAEEAGIDIEPPPQDLLEPTEDELVGDAPPETEPPEIVVEAVEAAEAGADAAEADEALEPDARNGAGAAADVAPVEMVSWDSAQVRLDHERSVTVDAAD
ncbi:MAG: hypothetical protein AB7O29_02610, partial [Acidimicrobiia bacterium]